MNLFFLIIISGIIHVVITVLVIITPDSHSAHIFTLQFSFPLTKEYDIFNLTFNFDYIFLNVFFNQSLLCN